MEEQWKPIIIEKNGEVYDYEGLYEVSNFGRVRSCDRISVSGHRLKGKIMKLTVDKTGYVFVALCKNGEQQRFTVHRLVATAFLPNPNDLPEVNHKDENPVNNHSENLEWCTHKYNMNYGTRSERAGRKMKGRTFTEEHKQKMSENHADISGSKNPRAHKVICIETQQVFNTIKEAEQWCGKKGVKECCRGRAKTCGGFHWQYLEDCKRQQRMNTDINNSKLIAA